MTDHAMIDYENGYTYVSIYETNKKCEKQLVLTAPTIKEAEWAFDELRPKIERYKNARIVWNFTFFTDEVAVGEIR